MGERDLLPPPVRLPIAPFFPRLLHLRSRFLRHWPRHFLPIIPAPKPGVQFLLRNLHPQCLRTPLTPLPSQTFPRISPLTAYAVALPSMPADRSCGYHAGVGRPPLSLPLPIPAPPPNPLVGLPYHLFHPFPPLFPLHSHSACHLRPISLFLACMAYKTPSAGCCHAMLHGRNFPTSCEFTQRYDLKRPYRRIWYKNGGRSHAFGDF
jgi:hypothetical protein